MTIYCDWPRAIVCDLCGTARLELPKSSTIAIHHDAAMRAAGWIEYAPRFVVKLFGGQRHAPPVHACGPCVVSAAKRQERLREASVQGSIDGTCSPANQVRRAGLRLDAEIEKKAASDG